jgi:hypothetical protein
MSVRGAQTKLLSLLLYTLHTWRWNLKCCAARKMTANRAAAEEFGWPLHVVSNVQFSGLESLLSTLIGDLIQVKVSLQNLKLSAHEEREKMGGAV